MGTTSDRQLPDRENAPRLVMLAINRWTNESRYAGKILPCVIL